MRKSSDAPTETGRIVRLLLAQVSDGGVWTLAGSAPTWTGRSSRLALARNGHRGIDPRGVQISARDRRKPGAQASRHKRQGSSGDAWGIGASNLWRAKREETAPTLMQRFSSAH